MMPPPPGTPAARTAGSSKRIEVDASIGFGRRGSPSGTPVAMSSCSSSGMPSRRGRPSGSQTRRSTTSRKSSPVTPFDELGEHPVRGDAVVLEARARLPFELPLGEALHARDGVGAFDGVHRRVREARRVQHHLLDGDDLLAVRRELGDVVRDRPRRRRAGRRRSASTPPTRRSASSPRTRRSACRSSRRRTSRSTRISLSRATATWQAGVTSRSTSARAPARSSSIAHVRESPTRPPRQSNESLE